ncbi:MAG TPA: glycine--tRNA ligase subunit beta [Acidiferrobacter sp.]|nr:glycine--tRNA ligase subunit beta [Acidiferrobacter sp.]
MIKTEDLLLEIGTEELPPKELHKLGVALAHDLFQALAENRLTSAPSQAKSFAAPRRLAVLISGVAARQTMETVERKGPAVASAFGKDGTPTSAAQGFARSLGVPVESLIRLTTDRGEFLGYRERPEGKTLAMILPTLIDGVLRRLPMGRRMRWGATETEFVRPVHWVVLLHGKRALKIPVLALTSGRKTRGHRFHAPKPIALSSAQAYAETLKATGYVLADFAERKDVIRAQVKRIAADINAQALIDPELLDLVTSLVEWPRALLGSFDKAFLDVPREALVAAMQGHQKYFPLEQKQRLLPHFITIANIESRDEAVVRKGNERVLAARFADARFFWQSDRKKRLETYGEGLKNVAFEQRLGSLADKVVRLQGLVRVLARLTKNDEALAGRAALLSKADLLTGMVGEFPELQGIMGGHYARHDQEEPSVATAIAEHYQPRFSGDALPTTGIGRILALADRLDTLIGIFGVGLAPTGDKDPFALRRSAIGALRLLDALGEDSGCDIEVSPLIIEAFAQYPHGLLAPETPKAVADFLTERLRHLLEGSYSGDAVDAGLAYGVTKIHDVGRRVKALAGFAQNPDATALIGANKRIRNILKQAPTAIDHNRPLTLSVPAEVELAKELRTLRPDVERWLAAGDYDSALLRLCALRPAVDAFFQDVLVMADDEQVRCSRLTLLSQLASLFERIGDVSRLKVSGEPYERS